MIHTLRVVSRLATDPYGQDVLAEIRRTLGMAGIERLRTARVYRVESATGAEAAHPRCRPRHFKRERGAEGEPGCLPAASVVGLGRHGNPEAGGAQATPY